MIKLILKYIIYFITSKNQHYVHSPFIFDFITKVLYLEKKENPCYDIEILRKHLCKSKKEISIIDFGARSKINTSNKRKIKDIAQNSTKREKFGRLFYRIVKFYKPKKILELGTSLGISTAYLAKGNPKGKIYTFEGCPSTLKVAKKNLQNLELTNIEYILGDFKYTLSKNLNKIKDIDLIFIDGNHRKKPTIEYFKTCLNYSKNNTILIFDDINWSKGMQEAWKYIKEHPKTRVTIDLFFIGIVFLRSELSKEDFKIRF